MNEWLRIALMWQAVFLFSCAWGEGVAIPKEEIIKLKFDARSGVSRMRLWDDGIIAIGNKYPYWTLSAAQLSPKAFSVSGMADVQSIGKMDGADVVLGVTVNSAHLSILRREGDKWFPIPDFPASKGEGDLRIIPCNKGLAVLSIKHLFHYENGVWSQLLLRPDNPGSADYNWGGRSGRRQCLFNSQLYLGPVLSSLDTIHPELPIHRVEIKDSSPAIQASRSRMVTAMRLDSQNSLWVCEANGGQCPAGEVYRYDGKEWKTEIRQQGNEFNNSPDNPCGNICDTAFSPHGKMYLLVERVGIVAYEDGKLVPKIKIDFSTVNDLIETSRSTQAKDIPRCYSNELAVDGEENIFVATTAYGVLCFIKSGESYEMKQVMMPW